GIIFERRVVHLEDKVFELLTKMYSEMTGRFETLENKLDEKTDKSDIVRLENELTPKIEALFDGYKQHTDILERIEKRVANQDEIIMRRIK
ncbi:MAG TPA: hypothetical protein VN580_03195, partial [Clostridia bacterium]|nr:hypothetical protein [Clostridia bacterium]